MFGERVFVQEGEIMRNKDRQTGNVFPLADRVGGFSGHPEGKNVST